MVVQDTSVRMTPVDSKLFESVGYCDASRHLYVKYRDGRVVMFQDVPRFRIQGLLSSPRKDAYFKTYVKDAFLSQVTKLPGQP